MKSNSDIDSFLANYSEPVIGHALKLRKLILGMLPNIIEQVDIPAKMIAYSYGNKLRFVNHGKHGIENSIVEIKYVSGKYRIGFANWC